MYYSAWRQHKLDPVSDTPSEETQSTLSSAYRDAVRSIDGFAERLLADIDLRDPLLIFHSDHGESFGEHGTFGHQQQLYEENIHVPLFVHNTEFSETVPKPFSLRSLPNLLTDLSQPVDPLRPSKYTSDYVCATTEQGDKAAVRGQRWKYITSEGKDELYDLRKDPEEQRNLAAHRQHVFDSMQRLLIKRQIDRAERNGIESAVRSIFPEV
jgi:arylsulfatase A-like enzyme